MTEAELILRKALVGSNLDSRQWNRVQAAIRNRAFFSSQVARLDILAALRDRAAEYAERGVDASEFRKLLRRDLEALRYAPKPGEENTIKDLFSKARLDAILETNAAQARGWIEHVDGMSAGAFAAFPAQEFVRVEQREKPRDDWPQRWRAAGGRFFDGRMVAMKDDPVWQNLGDAGPFGNPYPPFDWGSGMGVMDVSREEAVELGLVDADELRGKVEKIRQAPVPDFNEGLQATVPFNGENDPGWKSMKAAFGDQIVYKDGVVKWKGELLRDIARGEGTVRLGKSSAQLLSHFSGTDREHLENTSLTFTGDWVRQHAGKHVGANETNPQNEPLTPGDFELLPSIWRTPDGVEKGKYAGASILTLDTFDGCVLKLVIDHRSGAMPLSFWKMKNPGGA